MIEFQKSLPSVQHEQNIRDMKEKFENAVDESTLMLHKRLEELTKYSYQILPFSQLKQFLIVDFFLLRKRTTSCWIKFSAMSSMDPNSRGIHNILDRMNDSYREHVRAENSKKAPTSDFFQWYLDLKFIVDTYYYNDSVLLRLLYRISDYAKVPK